MVRGDREYPMVADCAATIASRLPRCRRVVIPGTDHMLPLRTPDRLAEIIADHAGLAVSLDLPGRALMAGDASTVRRLRFACIVRPGRCR
jgi:hypothetical protein